MAASDPFRPVEVWLSDVISHRKVAYLLNKKGVVLSKRRCYRLLAGWCLSVLQKPVLKFWWWDLV